MRIHAIQTGRLIGNKTFLRGKGWSQMFRQRQDFEFPAYVYILEHPDGHIAIDTGMNVRGWPTPGPVKRFLPHALIEPGEEIGPQMQAQGLRPEDVRTVIITHLDPDHIGGIGYFKDAEFLVHRREHDFAHSRMGRLRQRPQGWPDWFAPTLYDLDGDPHGPFPASKALSGRGDIRAVPLPGHTVGQVGLVAQASGATVFFAADHMVNRDWFLEDGAAGRLSNVGIAAPKEYANTNRRIHQFIAETPVVLLPAHDPGVPQRLEALEPVRSKSEGVTQ